MKIFAKRGSKNKPSLVQKPSISDADASVLELLKKDPCELNSKERRMIKRYEDRKKNDDGEVEVATNEIEIDDAENLEKEPKSTEESSEEFKELTQPEGTKPESEKNINPEQDSDGINEQKARELLDKLNSKSKRKLTRQLEREGSASLKSIYDEASRLIQELKESSIIEDKEGDKSKKRKRSKSADWSSLPAEERLRREEQRRSQKEAAERRAREGDQPNKKYKHPLNSERRRANRRKPKWSITSKKQQDPNEHDTSGYHMRRLTK
mmetsp:Transcript_15162/g.22346  ORF Transcript_15162/g.22346 Transcript_15162/m.22346 type:complete len:267 (-) Transcript_15162:11-811(-)